jgi:hypothetical protein
MGLFGTKKSNKMTSERVVEMFAEYYQRRGLDIKGHGVPGCDGYGWWITEGSAKIYIFVQEDRIGNVVRVHSPILKYPETKREAFFLRLLETNRDLSGCCVSAFDGVIMVSGQRPITGLDQEELNTLIWNVSYVADTLDDQLAEEFGAELYKEAQAHPA